MKASELMIGDFVICDFAIAKPGITGLRVCQVVSVDGNRDCVGLYDIEDEDRDLVGRYGKHIEPIPLTEEILKANFTLWHKSEYRKEYEYDKEDGYVNVIMRPSHFYLHVMVGNNEFNLHMKVSFVHQLQHALRLGGLNDLADNFKVNE